MTAQVLLDAHNYHHYFDFFAAARDAVGAGTFAHSRRFTEAAERGVQIDEKSASEDGRGVVIREVSLNTSIPVDAPSPGTRGASGSNRAARRPSLLPYHLSLPLSLSLRPDRLTVLPREHLLFDPLFELRVGGGVCGERVPGFLRRG